VDGGSLGRRLYVHMQVEGLCEEDLSDRCPASNGPSAPTSAVNTSPASASPIKQPQRTLPIIVINGPLLRSLLLMSGYNCGKSMGCQFTVLWSDRKWFIWVHEVWYFVFFCGISSFNRASTRSTNLSLYHWGNFRYIADIVILGFVWGLDKTRSNLHILPTIFTAMYNMAKMSPDHSTAALDSCATKRLGTDFLFGDIILREVLASGKHHI
jgi:hypothetical protein